MRPSAVVVPSCGPGLQGCAPEGPPRASSTRSSGSSGPSGPVSARFGPRRGGPTGLPDGPGPYCKRLHVFLWAVGTLPARRHPLVSSRMDVVCTCVRTCARPCPTGPRTPGYCLAVEIADQTLPALPPAGSRAGSAAPNPSGLAQSTLRASAESVQRPPEAPQTRLRPLRALGYQSRGPKGLRTAHRAPGGHYSYSDRTTPWDSSVGS